MGGLFTVCPHRALALLSDGGSSWSALGLGLSLPPWALVAVGEAGELRNGDGLGVELEAVSGGAAVVLPCAPIPFRLGLSHRNDGTHQEPPPGLL